MISTNQQLFDEIIKVIKLAAINYENISNDGRANSIKNEKTIIDVLKNSHINDYIIDESLYFHNFTERKVGDIYFKNLDKPDDILVVNIKSSNGKTSDNAFSKIGMLYAFTDIPFEKLHSTISWKNFTKYLMEHYCENNNRDYYYLYVNKNNNDECLIRGMKKISCFKSNPSNILQIYWSKESQTSENNLNVHEAFININQLITDALKKDVDGKQFFIDNCCNIHYNSDKIIKDNNV